MSLTEATPLAGAALASSRYSDWTDDREALLTRLWGLKGWSARRIAAEIGGFEQCVDGGKCAVIGKARRLGLALPPKLPPRKLAKPRTRHIASHLRQRAAEAKQAPEPETAPPIFSATPCALEELTDDTCRFPIGDPGTPEFHFCGGMVRDGAPYCAGHMRICYSPQAPARPRAERKETGWG